MKETQLLSSLFPAHPDFKPILDIHQIITIGWFLWWPAKGPRKRLAGAYRGGADKNTCT
jgi:hypothetical protein